MVINDSALVMDLALRSPMAAPSWVLMTQMFLLLVRYWLNCEAALLAPKANHIPRVFLYCDAVDFRKQSNGLAAIVELELDHNPFDGGLYVFTNRAHNKIKCLMWEDNGFVLYYRALAEECFK